MEKTTGLIAKYRKCLQSWLITVAAFLLLDSGRGGVLECSFYCLKQCRIINALEVFIWYVQIEQLNVWHFDGYACWEFLQLGECYMTQVRKIKNYYKA